MKKLTLIVFLFIATFNSCWSQAADTLYINYQIKPPFALIENSMPKGVEIDIINEYVLWLKLNKKMNVVVKYNSFADFEQFYGATKKGSKNTLGLGGVVMSPEKAKEVDFTNPYIKNVAFCITNGNAPDIKTKTKPEIVKALGSMTALTIDNSNLSKYVTELKKVFIPDLKVTAQPTQIKILDEISKNVLNFAYVDAIEFWFYLKANPGKFLKMQKVMNQSKEDIGFVIPKGSPHKTLFNEFFSGANGFKTNRNYRTILEKYVGAYMTQNLAVN